jgi:hypothetical protein
VLPSGFQGCPAGLRPAPSQCVIQTYNLFGVASGTMQPNPSEGQGAWLPALHALQTLRGSGKSQLITTRPGGNFRRPAAGGPMRHFSTISPLSPRGFPSIFVWSRKEKRRRTRQRFNAPGTVAVDRNLTDPTMGQYGLSNVYVPPRSRRPASKLVL